MGIFSLFGKKDERGKTAEQGKSRSRAKRPQQTKAAALPTDVPTTVPRPPKRDPQLARATVLKIDAIESEMSSEFIRVKPVAGKSSAPAKAVPAKAVSTSVTAPAPQPAEDMGTTTGFLLESQATLSAVTSTATATIEEAAILYANGQADVVEQMLEAAAGDDALNEVTQKAWLMLFDLYQLRGKQQEFEQLALAYAERFETSPPGWHAPDAEKTAPATGTIPLVSFSGKLDETAGKMLERLRNLAAQHKTLRLEFARISTVTPAGCAMLLERLQLLQKYDHELILVGAPELAGKIRATLTPGRRDDSEPAWLLLLELLRLLNREQEFEETSIDYCVTFEVSPPAFVAPQSRITTAAVETAPASEGFPLPPVVEGNIDNLIVAIAAYSDQHAPAIIDCSRLQRVDFNAAGRLLTGLAPFCSAGKTIEFHHVNHLVAELFTVIGLNDIVRVLPRRS